MSGYLLCSSRLATHPYQVEGLGIRIYSAEELCYYIFHHVQVIGEEFLEEPLFTFLEKELGLAEESAHIRKYVERQAEFSTVLTAILREFRYYSDQEIGQFQGRLDALGKQTPLERQCKRADFLLEKRRVQAAFHIYENIMAGRKSRGSQQFYGMVAQRMAVCCLQQFQYSRGMKYLQAAFQEWPDERILKQLVQVCLLCGKELPEELLKNADASRLYQWKQEYEQSRDLAETAAASCPQAAIFDRDSIRRKEELKRYMADLKKEYREMTE
ncbi:ferredoxin [Cuneatibacter caecimuris]|uniref:Uncharacterized protein n=1 Tax=Cuneatibacter caecimuris TaxID=1796618 RepID=A0A4Q7PK09_9FIRM|nr:ferredoxin [Cuneatibacter caecimuris]RZT01041.1 hypothetical protein EV209_1479 [Cuneatibacter caecimuris]